MDLAVLPDGRVLHTARTGEVRLQRPARPASTARRPRSPSTSTTRRACRASRSTRTSTEAQQLGLPLLLAAARHAGRRPGDARRQRGRRPARPAPPADFAPFKGYIRLSRFKFERRQDRPRAPSSRSSTCPSTAASAATSAATSTSTATATCILSTGDDTNPFAVRRLHADRRAAGPQPGVRRPAHRRQHQRPARQDAAHHARRRRRLHDPARATCSRPAPPQTRPEIYVDGPAQPVPLRGRPGDRRRLRRRLLAGRRRGRPRARAGRPRPLDGRRRAGQLRLAVLRRPPTLPYVDYDFATETSGEPFDCAAPVNDSPHNTGLTRAAAGRAAGGLVLVRRSRASSPSSGTGGIGPMAGPAYQYDKRDDPGPNPVAWPSAYDGKPLLLRVDARLHQGVPRSRTATTSRPSRTCVDRHRASTTRWTWSSARTARSTCSSTATATSPRTRTRSSSRIDFVGPRGNRSPDAGDRGRRRRPGTAPLTVAVLQQRHDRPGRRPPPLRVGLRRRRQRRLRERNPTYTYTRERHLPGHAEGDRPAAPRQPRVDVRRHRRSATRRPVVEFVTPIDGDSRSSSVTR